MFDVKSDKFWVILFSEVGGRTDEMTGLADAGRFEVRGVRQYIEVRCMFGHWQGHLAEYKFFWRYGFP